MRQLGLFLRRYWWKILYMVALVILRAFGYVRSDGLFHALLLIPAALNILYYAIKFEGKKEELHLVSSHTPIHVLKNYLPEPQLTEWIDVKREANMCQCFTVITLLICYIDLLFF